jgi:putative membrane protein
MKKLLSQIVAATLGLWLATLVAPSVIVKVHSDSNFFGAALTAQWQIFLLLGIILGLLNHFVRPALKALTLPLEIVTLGLFSLVINAAMILILDRMFAELYVPWMYPLLYTTLIIWGLNLIIQKFILKTED